MTAEQLEELQRLIARAKKFSEQARGHDAPLFEAELLKMADSMDHLARRVLAAEKLADRLDEILDDNRAPWYAVHEALTAYREASK